MAKYDCREQTESYTGRSDRHFLCNRILSLLFTLKAFFCAGYNTLMSPIDCQQLERHALCPDQHTIRTDLLPLGLDRGRNGRRGEGERNSTQPDTVACVSADMCRTVVGSQRALWAKVCQTCIDVRQKCLDLLTGAIVRA